jgi:hypothetical protein
MRALTVISFMCASVAALASTRRSKTDLSCDKTPLDFRPDLNYINYITTSFCGSIANGLGVDENHLDGKLNRSDAIAYTFPDPNKATGIEYFLSVINTGHYTVVIPVQNSTSSITSCEDNLRSAWTECKYSHDP